MTIKDLIGALILMIACAIWLYPALAVRDYIEHIEEFRMSDDQILLSQLIQSEAGANDIIDMYLIGSVVLNRTNCRSDFPGTIDSVVHQHRQFSAVKTKGFYKRNPLSDSVVVDLYNGVGRNYEVLYFFNPKYATDTSFVNSFKGKRVLVRSRGHLFY